MLDRQTGKFRWYVHSASANSISHNNVKAIWYDEGTDQIWLGLHLGGLNRLDIRSGRFFAYRHEAGNPATIPSDIVRDILPYGDSLVVATQQGVCLLSKATGKCRQLFGESPEGDKSGWLLIWSLTGQACCGWPLRAKAPFPIISRLTGWCIILIEKDSRE